MQKQKYSTIFRPRLPHHQTNTKGNPFIPTHQYQTLNTNLQTEAAFSLSHINIHARTRARVLIRHRNQGSITAVCLKEVAAMELLDFA